MANTPHDRLKLAREHAGFKSARSAAEHHRFNYVTYKAHESGLRGMKNAQAEVYGKAFGVSASWIAMGENAPEWDAPPDMVRRRTPIRSIPVLTLEKVPMLRGQMRPVDLGPIGLIAIDDGDDLGDRPYAITIADDDLSMVPPNSIGARRLEPGDTVVANPDYDELKPGDFVIAEIVGRESAVIRKYQPRGRGKYDLSPLNPDYETFHIGEGHRGKVVARLARRTQKL